MSFTSPELMVNKEMLINLVRERPVLWGRNRDKERRKRAWQEIFHILRNDFDDIDEAEQLEYSKFVVRTWSQLRDCWVRSLNDRKKGKVSRRYIYHRQLRFLKPVIDNEDLVSDTEDEPINKPATSTPKGNVKMIMKPESAPKRKLTNEQTVTQPDMLDNDRHFAFFKSIHPSLSMFDDDQVLQFQSGVISLLQDIKSGNNYNVWSHPSASHWQSSEYYNKPPAQASPFESETSEDPFPETKFDVNEDSK